MRRFMRRFMRWSRVRQLALCVASAIVAAAGLLLFYDALIATFILAVVFCHEFGHFFAARRHGAALPLFVPLGIFLMGVTAVRPRQKVTTYLAGPFAGLAATLGVAAAGFVLGSSTLLVVAGLLAVGEVFNATLGGDGRKIRQALI